MKPGQTLRAVLVAAAGLNLWCPPCHAEQFPLTIKPAGRRIELSWPAALTNAGEQRIFPQYRVQVSRDLEHWSPLGGMVRGLGGRSGASLSLYLEREAAPVFYRVSGDSEAGDENQTGLGGAEVFGYGARFAEELRAIGRLPVGDFATNAAGIVYLPTLTWDPTTAQFWTNFNSPEPHYLEYGPFSAKVAYNYKLDTNELPRFMTNGFVVSERLGAATFGDAYYRLFNADLPVFITSDSVLHAWHRSYQGMLQELEQLVLAGLLDKVVSGMSSQLPRVWEQYGGGPLRDSILDADYYLTVVRSLLSGGQVAAALDDPAVAQQVSQTLADIAAEQLKKVPIFGANRWVDFSQFKVRGHYEKTIFLRRYFRAMMWCGRTELRLATFQDNKENDTRQLGSVIVLRQLLRESGQFTNWSAIEQATRMFVGVTDSMTFAQVEDLLANANIETPADVPDLVTLTNLQTRLLTGELGVQSIHGDFLWSPFSPEQVKLPRAFTVCGQKFIADSWAFSQVVFDRVLWEPDDGVRVIYGKVIRRKPSCLDVAYSVLGNDHVIPDIVERIRDANGVPFRDGLPYQHNLLAARRVMDAHDPSLWTENIYMAWLNALRALSAPLTDSRLPEAMRTRAWAMKNLNTQLGSWTELRHDTILYAKQSYTEPLACGYPDGFVEPVPEFWRRMRLLAEVTATNIMALPFSGTLVGPGPNPGGAGSGLSWDFPKVYDLGEIKATLAGFLGNFGLRMRTLEEISNQELEQKPLTAAQTEFLQDVVERTIDYVGQRRWNGWYPGIYYTSPYAGAREDSKTECDIWDPLVADVHTDLPDPIVGDPGAVIHEGVGNVHLLMIAVDNGPDRMVYAGPVYSHYEFELPGVARMADSEWKSGLSSGQRRPSPPWTESFLAPGPFTMPPGYQ